MAFAKYPDPKDSDDILDYVIDWRPQLQEGETVETNDCVVVSGDITIDSFSIVENQTVFWLSGGKPGETAYVRDRVTTSGGRQYDMTVGVRIRVK